MDFYETNYRGILILNKLKKNNKLIFWVAITILILAVLSGIFYIYINGENFRNNLKSIIISQLKENLENPIEIGKIDYVSLQLVQLSDITVFEDIPSENKEILFRADKAKISFTLLFPILHWNNWHLTIRNMAFSNASTSLTRKSTGKFDYFDRLKIDLTKIHENITINHINFENSYLVYHDEMVYNHHLNRLTTRAKNIDGYFDLSQLPRIEIDFQGIQEKDNAILGLSGQFCIWEPDYSLDFHLENADITHFQYFLEVADLFNIDRGRFTTDFNLSHSSDSKTLDANWKGMATFQQADFKPQFLNQIPFHQVNGSVQFSNPEITIEDMTGLYYDKNIQLDGQVISETGVSFDLDIFSEAVSVPQLKSDILSFIPDLNDLSLNGEIGFSVNAKGKTKGLQIDTFQVEGDAFSPEILFEDISFKKVDCSFLFNQDELIVKSLNTSEENSVLAASGNIVWDKNSPFYQFSLQTENLSIRHPLFEQASIFNAYSGNIDSNLQITNKNIDNPMTSIEGFFTLKDFKTGKFLLNKPVKGNFSSTIDLTEQSLSVDQCEIEFGQNKGNFEGKLNLEKLDGFAFEFGIQVPELTDIANYLNMETIPTGIADIKGTLSGSSQNPIIEAEFNLLDFSIQDNSLGNLTGKLHYNLDIISLENLILTNQDIELTGEGKIVLEDKKLPEINISYQLDSVNLKPFIESYIENVSVSGFTSGNGKITGIWPKPEIQGNFQLKEIMVEDYLLGQGEIDFLLQPGDKIPPEDINSNTAGLFNQLGYYYTFQLKRLILQNDSMNLEAIGQTEFVNNNPFSIEIDFSHDAFEEITNIFYADENYIKRFLPSEISGNANIQGDMLEQKIILSASLNPRQKNNNPPSKLETEITLSDKGLQIADFDLIQSEGILKAKGSINPAQEVSIDFQAEKLDIGLLANLMQIEENIEGIINIEGNCTGTVEQPQISVIAQVNKGYFRTFQFENLLGNLYWDSKKNEIEVLELTITLEEDNLIQAKGNLPLDVFSFEEEIDIEENISDMASNEIPLDFQINMQKARLNLLKIFWKEAFSEITGDMNLELYLSGTSKKPILNGIIDINQGNIGINNLPIEMEEINTSIKITDNLVEISDLYFTAYENRLNISGQFEIIQFMPENILLNIKNDKKRITYQDILESNADFLAEIRGSLSEPIITGTLTLSEGEMNLEELMQLYDETRNITDINGNSKNYLDLNLEIADPFTLILPDAKIDVTGKINLGGSFTEPAVGGNIVLKKGYLIYFEKRFVFSDGRVVINSLSINDIEINANANTNVQDVQISINVSGNLASPKIQLSSLPVLNQAEIVSLLTLNRNIQGLSEGEISQILSQEMVDIIFQSLQINLFKRMERELAEELGLEFIRFHYDMPESSSTNLFILENLHPRDLKLEIGKNFGEDVLFTYSTSLDFVSETSLSIDYQISPTFSFSTQFDSYSITEEDYRFKFGLEVRF